MTEEAAPNEPKGKEKEFLPKFPRIKSTVVLSALSQMHRTALRSDDSEVSEAWTETHEKERTGYERATWNAEWEKAVDELGSFLTRTLEGLGSPENRDEAPSEHIRGVRGVFEWTLKALATEEEERLVRLYVVRSPEAVHKFYELLLNLDKILRKNGEVDPHRIPRHEQ